MLNWIVWNRTDYLYKMDLALNNLQRLMCHKTQTTNQPTNHQNPQTNIIFTLKISIFPLSIYLSIDLRGAYDKFPDFFRMGTFIDNC